MNEIPMPEHTAESYQIWAVNPEGTPVYLYRDSLIYSVADDWARAWNTNRPSNIAEGWTFAVVKATTSYAVVDPTQESSWRTDVAEAAKALIAAQERVPDNVAHYAIDQALPHLMVLARLGEMG